MKFLFIIFLSLLLHLSADPNIKNSDEAIAAYSKLMEKFYELGQNEQWRDITPEILSSSATSPLSKEEIKLKDRRIIVFKYPSDGLWIKGFISFTPSPTHHPLLILYRGGNDNFGLLNPANPFSIYGEYTVISSTLRGGVSEGKDEFGGKDVDDIKNMIDFLPTLAQNLGIELHPSCTFMLGISRGGMEMFLALARFPELQNKVNKVVALSSVLDIHQMLRIRADDMKLLLQSKYGWKEGPQGEPWIAKRDPLNTIPFLKKSLPILIVQGTADNRVNLEQGYHMISLLKTANHAVSYWEVKGGEHALMSTPYIMNDIARWLESGSTCINFRIPKN